MVVLICESQVHTIRYAQNLTAIQSMETLFDCNTNNFLACQLFYFLSLNCVFLFLLEVSTCFESLVLSAVGKTNLFTSFWLSNIYTSELHIGTCSCCVSTTGVLLKNY